MALWQPNKKPVPETTLPNVSILIQAQTSPEGDTSMLPTFHYVVELFLLASLLITLLKCLKYKSLSEKDQFTSAYHKQWLNINLVNLMRKAKSKNETLAVAFVDLDKFKKINDTWGHDYGDKVLLAVVKAIHSVIGKTGKLVRYGGDEFIIVRHVGVE